MNNKKVKIINLNTKVKEIMPQHVRPDPWAVPGWCLVLDMTLLEFLDDSLRERGFGAKKYKEVIRTAVFHKSIDDDAREYILQHVI